MRVLPTSKDGLQTLYTKVMFDKLYILKSTVSHVLVYNVNATVAVIE